MWYIKIYQKLKMHHIGSGVLHLTMYHIGALQQCTPAPMWCHRVCGVELNKRCSRLTSGWVNAWNHAKIKQDLWFCIGYFDPCQD